MRVVLLDDIVNVGEAGNIVEVKDGYARNFLIPHGKARRATESAIKEFELRRAELEKIQADKLAAAQTDAEKLNGLTVQLTEKAGVDGRLFGSVTNANIADALRKQGFEVQKAMVHVVSGQIKNIGDHKVEIALHSDAKAEITVSVLAEAT